MTRLCMVYGLLGAAAAPASAPAERQFVQAVLPILSHKCFGCHGDDPDDVRGDFDLRSRAGLLEGGETGLPALVPGNPEQSPLYRAVTWQIRKFRMPPKKNDRLTSEQVAAIRVWIAAGAPWPDADRIRALQAEWAAGAAADGVVVRTSGGRAAEWNNRRYRPEDLWAYQPVRRPDLPDHDAHPIDAFLNRKLDAADLEPAPRAGRRTLIRRITYDLIGLPPTPEEVTAFVTDPAHDAFDRLIERLLGSPHYGEQQARRWLDVVRYADTAGFANDYERPNAWRYRDYVIRAFNRDKPFDRFIVEQLAGDELDPDDPELRIAVGFLRMGPWEHTGMSVAAVTRQQYLDDVTHAVGQTFLAQGLRCARCHDHKFDPVPTKDHYRIQAVFAPVQFAEANTPFLAEENVTGFAERRVRVARRLKQARDAAAVIGAKSRDAEARWLTEHGLDPAKAGKRGSLPEDQRPPRNLGLSKTDLGVRKVLQKRQAYFQRQLLRFEPLSLSAYSGPPRKYQSNQARHPMPAPRERRGTVPVVHILDGGALESPAEPVTPGVLSAMHGANDGVQPTAWNTIPAAATGRRLAFARWVASPNNTLTARVIVNRIWQQHFGDKGLVGTPNDFGKMGKRPTHPELLDWLAAWFVDHGWSIKKLHRLILTSQAYQRSGSHPSMADVHRVDPGNELLAAYPPRRLTAEALRDGMLAVSGELRPTMGGPAIRPEIHREVALQPRHIMGSIAPAYQPSPRPEQRNRRTIYAFRIRGLPDPLLEVFNQPGSDISCPQRDQTTVTPQVFALLNGQNTHDRALGMARRLETHSPRPRERIDYAFRLAFGRPPTADEQKQCIVHLTRMIEHHRTRQPEPTHPPTSVTRSMIEEMTGIAFEWTEPLDVYERGYVPDAKPWDVGPETRALAELCLVLLNANEFVYVY